MAKLQHFNRPVAKLIIKRSYFVKKSFIPLKRAGVIIWENFRPGSRNHGNRADAPSHTNTSEFLQRK